MRCKCIKTYVPSMQIGSYQTYTRKYWEELNKYAYLLNDRYELGQEVFDEYFVDVATVRNEQLNNLLE